jgi:hypothetical protein
MAVILCAEYVGMCVCSPVAEEKRKVAEIAYMKAVMSTRRRDLAATSLMELFQTIFVSPWVIGVDTMTV